MNILKNIFRRPVKNSEAVVISDFKTEILPQEEQQDILKELFVDEMPPQAKIQKAEKKRSRFSEFMERNYQQLGINDGYETGTQELMDSTIKKIKSEFIIILDQMIEEKRLSIVNLKNQIPAIGTLSPLLVQQLENTIEVTKDSIAELQKQKELSIENEGWVMSGIHSYKSGLLSGLQTKLEENNLLTPGSNFFTSYN